MSISGISSTYTPATTGSSQPLETEKAGAAASQATSKSVVVVLTMAQKKAEIEELKGQLPTIRREFGAAVQAFNKAPTLDNLEKLLACRNQLTQTVTRLGELGVRVAMPPLRTLDQLGALVMAPFQKATDTATQTFIQSPTQANLEKLLACHNSPTQTVTRLRELGATVGIPDVPTPYQLGVQVMAKLQKAADEALQAFRAQPTQAKLDLLVDCYQKVTAMEQGLAKLGIDSPQPDFGGLLTHRVPLAPAPLMPSGADLAADTQAPT